MRASPSQDKTIKEAHGLSASSAVLTECPTTAFRLYPEPQEGDAIRVTNGNQVQDMQYKAGEWILTQAG